MSRNKKYDALIKAVEADDVKGAERLLKQKANPNAADDKLAALHHAESAKMVNLLCDHGADPNLSVAGIPLLGERYTPIHTISYNGKPEALRAIVARGAKIDAVSSGSLKSAMHMARTPETVDAIVECGGQALINQRNYDGETPYDFTAYGAYNANQDVFIHLRDKHGAKSGTTLDREHAERVAAKKAESTAGVQASDQKGFKR